MFVRFMAWAQYPRTASSDEAHDALGNATLSTFVIQLVKQVNYGALESKRYFMPAEGDSTEFVEITEQALIQANFQKLNTYKNYKYDSHKKYFEINVYQKDPTNRHHWRVNVARPAVNIDLNVGWCAAGAPSVNSDCDFWL
ncbi:hypothetical protein SPBR_08737 [Sporothrix brasiliensis 5110]|uniref:Uncharacterized protein n=1 Tax=Sporothrix brasiliensis 5110 TaxID=1398154 RepID=A0A0C2EK68_9PEZI|nr:uncharacterized protein SPBR_08737 [Sporothrix brasiliensis 5110]KIH86489.1 hypothetical protein SPBR_08737 [Sporothrix brasiliensis 5110]